MIALDNAVIYCVVTLSQYYAIVWTCKNVYFAPTDKRLLVESSFLGWLYMKFRQSKKEAPAIVCPTSVALFYFVVVSPSKKWPFLFNWFKFLNCQHKLSFWCKIRLFIATCGKNLNWFWLLQNFANDLSQAINNHENNPSSFEGWWEIKTSFWSIFSSCNLLLVLI